MIKVKFSDLEINDEFECYGDIHLNYNYPKICKCFKERDNIGQEFDGISFGMHDSDEVWIEEKFNFIKELGIEGSSKCEFCEMTDGIHRADCFLMSKL